MQKLNFAETIDEILKQDNRYERDAYYFVREGLDFTLKMLKRGAPSGSRHVSGQELLEGLRRYALDQFGPMAKTVLGHWGVTRCEDFGAIVFSMVNKGILGKTEQDSPEDFKAGYDFDEAFVRPYRPSAQALVRRAPQEKSGGQPFRPKTRGAGAKKLSSGSN
jgi:uncharacterized repeat protein (TIGR04138 family)